MEEYQTNWLDAMCERQALPEEVREGTTEEFCKKWGVPSSTYYYQASKSENHERIVKIALNNAKKFAPEILNNLGERAKKDNKATEMYLKFILQLAEKTDITSAGEKLEKISNEELEAIITRSIKRGERTMEETE